MNPNCVLIMFFVLFNVCCSSKLKTGIYTNAYKKDHVYFAGTNLELLDSNKFQIFHFTDEIGYEKKGNGFYSINKNKLILEFEEEINPQSKNEIQELRIFVENSKIINDSTVNLNILILEPKVDLPVVFYKVKHENNNELLKTHCSGLDGKLNLKLKLSTNQDKLTITYYSSEKFEYIVNENFNTNKEFRLKEFQNFYDVGDQLEFEIRNGFLSKSIIDNEGECYKLK